MEHLQRIWYAFLIVSLIVMVNVVFVVIVVICDANTVKIYQTKKECTSGEEQPEEGTLLHSWVAVSVPDIYLPLLPSKCHPYQLPTNYYNEGA